MLRLSVSACSGGVVALRPSCALLLYRGDSTVADTSTNWDGAKNYEEIPGPKPLPFLGNAWRFMPFIGEFHNVDFANLQVVMLKKYGKDGRVAKIVGLPNRKDMVFLYNPLDVEKAYRNEGPWPIRDGIKTLEYYRTVLRKDFFQGEEGVALTQGKQWQEFRTKVNQPMMQPKSARLYVTPINNVAEEFINRMRDLRNDRGELPGELMKHMNKWALESIATIALDTRLGCLHPNLPKDSEPQRMIGAVQVMFQAIYELDMVPRLRHFTKYKIWDELVRALDTFNEVAMKYIDQAIVRMQERPPGDDRELSILERLLIQNENPKVACVMALDMLFAGVDTTSNAAAVLLHYLAKNQDKQQKLFEEIVNILPTKNQTITSKNLEDMKYLKACEKESMRLTPIAPGNLRETVKDIVLGNHKVPKGVDVFLCHMAMSQEEKNFAKPDCFIPERWLKGDSQEHKSHPFVFMPFGFGPRMCVGRRFAELELETLVSKVIRNFRLEIDEELKMRANAVNQVVSPLPFRLEERN